MISNTTVFQLHSFAFYSFPSAPLLYLVAKGNFLPQPLTIDTPDPCHNLKILTDMLNPQIY